MSINYYNSIILNDVSAKEKSFSLSNALYTVGDKLSQTSKNYHGKLYSINLGSALEETKIKTTGEFDQENPTLLQKITAAVGKELKKAAGMLNPEIKAKHMLAQELSKEQPNKLVLDGARVIILKLPGSQIVDGEGDDVGPKLMVDCCAQCCQACCLACLTCKT